ADLQQSNIVVSRSPDSNWQGVGLLDWQHASIILPPFLLAGVPERLQNYDDPILQSMAPSSLPETFHELDETNQSRGEELYRHRLVYYHYLKNTEEGNKLHYDVCETMELDEVQRGADDALEVCENVIDLGPEGWVPTQHYEEAMAFGKQMKTDALSAATSAEELDDIMGHWPLDHMDEEKYE
ncbi:hypothetical protein C0991_009463, partial [Blastosporella zonata]